MGAVHGSFKSLPAGDKWNGFYRDLGTSPGDWPAVLNMPPKHRVLKLGNSKGRVQ